LRAKSSVVQFGPICSHSERKRTTISWGFRVFLAALLEENCRTL
jgi:hypothetical protein